MVEEIESIKRQVEGLTMALSGNEWSDGILKKINKMHSELESNSGRLEKLENKMNITNKILGLIASLISVGIALAQM